MSSITVEKSLFYSLIKQLILAEYRLQWEGISYAGWFDDAIRKFVLEERISSKMLKSLVEQYEIEDGGLDLAWHCDEIDDDCYPFK